MTDKEAVEIFRNAYKHDIDRNTYWEAISVAINKLVVCQWHEYIPEEFRYNRGDMNFGSKVILGIRFDDGSCGTVNGRVLYRMETGYYLAIDNHEMNCYTEKAVIEKYMKYPKYE